MWFYGIVTIQSLKYLEKSDHEYLLIKEYNWLLDLLEIHLWNKNFLIFLFYALD